MCGIFLVMLHTNNLYMSFNSHRAELNLIKTNNSFNLIYSDAWHVNQKILHSQNLCLRQITRECARGCMSLSAENLGAACER